jgi:hypothetical protein
MDTSRSQTAKNIQLRIGDRGREGIVQDREKYPIDGGQGNPFHVVGEEWVTFKSLLMSV